MESYHSQFESINFEKAIEHIHFSIKSLKSYQNLKDRVEKINIESSIGRIVSETYMSEENIPAYPTSSMDGYAFKFSVIDNILRKDMENHENHENIKKEIEFQLKYKSFADGKVETKEKLLLENQLENRIECIYITTGSSLPQEYNIVIPIEEISLIRDNTITVNKSVLSKSVPNKYIREIGINYKKGDVLISKNTIISSIHIGGLISVGIQYINVYKKVNLGIFSTGDELIDIGNKDELNEGVKNPNLIYDSNRKMLLNIIKNEEKDLSSCINIIDYGIIKDNEESISTLLKKSIFECDFLISTGGVSMGEKDFVKKVILKISQIKNSDDLYCNIIYGRINIKPGLPNIFCILNGFLPYFALPGNPVSCIVGYYLLVKEAINNYVYVSSEYEYNNFELSHSNQSHLLKSYKILHDIELLHDIEVTSSRPEFLRGCVYFNTNTKKLICRATSDNQLSSSIKSLIGFNSLILISDKNNNEDKLIYKKGLNKVDVYLVKEMYLIDENEEKRIINSLLNVDYKKEIGNCQCGIKNDKENKGIQYLSPSKRLIIINIGILVVSDKLADGKYSKNQALINFLEYFKVLNLNNSQSNQSSKSYTYSYNAINMGIVNNNEKVIEEKVNYICTNNLCNILILSGGTGLSIKDVTTTVINRLLNKTTNGLSHYIISENIKINPSFCLSSITSGVYKDSLIITFPGNPNSISEILNKIHPMMIHIYNQLKMIDDH